MSSGVRNTSFLIAIATHLILRKILLRHNNSIVLLHRRNTDDVVSKIALGSNSSTNMQGRNKNSQPYQTKIKTQNSNEDFFKSKLIITFISLGDKEHEN